MFIGLYGEIRSSLYLPVLLPLSVRVSPVCCYAHVRGKDLSCALSLRAFTFFHIWFPQIFQYPPLDFTGEKCPCAPVINTNMETRKKPERKIPLPEEPRRARAPSSPKRARIYYGESEVAVTAKERKCSTC